ncbi:LPXTG cell wall anchor domain-containing protein [Streptomyces camelliae]|uniref:LPXTG cell wall anchor domain-containing protein n=1 Tax=Streptomyces camelliae TaxID=3004093 RepID=A0ABY7NU26_9ACTN|nr:LPXTG cell wall anchor domain-containing protein [Streptomyces sp. HUAS 2-6]WBO61672.1 LPXTG cell wall anchor domain-containing protein [Streptomyces sp. HUAS 2-6]
MNTLAHKVRSSVTVSGTALLLAAAGFGLAPTASAGEPQPPTLAVATAAPAEVGLAGLPVAFTTKVSNTGAYDTSSARLIYRIDGGAGLPSNAVSLQYRLSGTAWKTVPLTYADEKFSGEIPETFPLAAGRSRTVQLRIGVPMGTPHNGDSNGGTQRLKLTTLVSYGSSGAATGTDDDTIKVDGLSTGLSGVPATVTAGGSAVSFEATVTNPTASRYENVTDTLITNRYASVQVLRSGTWKTLKPLTSNAEADVYGFDVIGKDASLAAHSSTVAKVRVTYRKDTPTGKATVQPCVFVNEGSIPFRGTTSCGDRATLTVLAAGSTGSNPGTPVPSPTASATPAPSGSPSTSAEAPSATSGTTSGTSGASSQLAKTGSSGTSTIAAAAGAFLLAGAGALGVVGLRRRRTRA